jgi:hypothetical protein
MINLGIHNYEITRVPEISDETNISCDSVLIEIDNNNINGTGRTFFSGYFGVDITELFNQQSNHQIKESLEKDFFKGSNKYHLLDYKMVNQNSREKPVQLNYSFVISDYAVHIDSNIFINLNLDKTILNNKIEKTRQTPYVFDYKGDQILIVKLKIPSGYVIEYLPEDSFIEEPGFAYFIKYQNEKNCVIFSRKIIINQLSISNDVFHKWNQIVSQYQDISRNTIILKKL